MTKAVSDSEFEAEVTNSKEPVLIDFWADWCGPCKMLSPIIDQISEEMKGTIKVLKMDVDNNPESPSRFGVRSIPTLMIFKDGKEVATKIGAHPKNTIMEWVKASI